MDLITVATCSLNNWALDFDGNKSRILAALRRAKVEGARLLATPELSLSGYGCLDHFLELDLIEGCWDKLGEILIEDAAQDILFDVGMPINHEGVYYNARVICHNRQVLLIRPKLSLANDGNFREQRYFTEWPRQDPPLVEEHMLPSSIFAITGQRTAEFGECLLSTVDTVLGVESCEELFTPNSPHIGMGLRGAEIFTNSSGSHHQLRKLDQRVQLIVGATAKSGGVYLYANQQGCDGDRLYYDGCALIVVNGDIKAQGSQFSLNDLEVVTATVNLQEVRSFRYAPSRRNQVSSAPRYKLLNIDIELTRNGDHLDPSVKPSASLDAEYHRPEEEIGLGPACWLWDYLRRSRQAGFFVPLSGGIDSCSTAVIVYCMCREVFKAVQSNNEQVIQDMCRICGEPDDWRPSNPQEICHRLFATAYMGTKAASSSETRQRAKDLAESIGAYHIDCNIDPAVSAISSIAQYIFGTPLRFKVHGGTTEENIALQNLQARLRMVLSYFFAQIIPYHRQRKGGGSLLVLGSGNVDECLRGYLTKYDCSSADLNPIGSISKIDLKAFIKWANEAFDLPILSAFLDATPTAELEPITESHVQSDEVDMGISYEELSIFGRLRKVDRLGPWGQWNKLMHLWNDRFSPRQIYEKVRHFNHYYGINRHKMTTMTPAYHAEQYSPDDNRYDLRPFLYPTLTWAYGKIESALQRLEAQAA